MEENYILAKQVVRKKFNPSNDFYYMFICSLFGLFMKYPEHKELIIKAFEETRIIIENKSVLEIQDEYDLQLIPKEELDIQDEKVCMNHGVSDLGFSIAIKNGKLEISKERPIIVCSAKTCSTTNLLNVFTHELNHIIKGQLNAYGSSSNQDVSSCYTRCGLVFNSYTYTKESDILEEEEYYSILDEVINVFQTREIMKNILMLDGVVPDLEFQKYFDSLDKEEMVQLNGYDKCCELFTRIWRNQHLRDILERNLIDGELENITIEFDDAVGMECFDIMADYFDDLDYLFCVNKSKRNFEKCYIKLNDLISSIATSAYKLKK